MTVQNVKSPYACVVFDCDGTLVDNEVLCNEILAERLRVYGIVESAKELSCRYRGGHLEQTLQDLTTRHGVDVGCEFVSEYRVAVERAFVTKLREIPGVGAALERISMPKCVASNSPQRRVEVALRATGLLGHFGPNVFSAYSVGAWKPSPKLFLHAARCMQVEPARCAVIEDSQAGIAAALSAGMAAYWYDPRSEHRTAMGSAVPVESMADLPELLESKPRGPTHNEPLVHGEFSLG